MQTLSVSCGLISPLRRKLCSLLRILSLFWKALVKDAFYSLCLFPSLSCFCVLAGVDRHCLGIGVCLKSLTVMCAKDLSPEYTFCKWFTVCRVLGHRKKVAEGSKNPLLFVLCDVEQGLPTGLASWFVQTPHVKLSCETSHGMTTFMDASSVMKLRNPLTRRKNNIH